MLTMTSDETSSGWNFEYLAENESATDALGVLLADVLERGLVVGLIGPLGAGKTRLVKATATALGADPSTVSSPTFVLIQEYDGRLPVYHFDTYRLRDVAAFADLGADEYFNGDGVCFVEWADRVSSLLPRDRLNIAVSVLGPMSRRFCISSTGPTSQRLLLRLNQRQGERGARP